MENVSSINKEIDKYMDSCHKVKDREIRKDIINDILEVKEKTTQIMSILRNSVGKFSNIQIAQLNDMAYRAVRKVGLQKKIDDRAVKNEILY